MKHKIPDDFIVSTGETFTLKDFISECFNFFNLNWRDHIEIDKCFFRPNEIIRSCGNPEKANKVLGWEAKNKMKDVVKKMVKHELKSYKEGNFE